MWFHVIFMGAKKRSVSHTRNIFVCQDLDKRMRGKNAFAHTLLLCFTTCLAGTNQGEAESVIQYPVTL